MDYYKVLDYLEGAGHLRALDYSKKCVYSSKMSNYVFDLFDINVPANLGVIYTKPVKPGEHYVIDGLSRLITVSLFLLAICECWKNTTERNLLFISKIKSKYLLRNDRPKLILTGNSNRIYESLMLGERISGRDKKTVLFCTYHEYWTKLKLGHYEINEIMEKLEKLFLYEAHLDTDEMRDFYYTINSDSPKLNQVALIRDFLIEHDAGYEWGEIEQLFYNNKDYLMMFLRDYLITKYKSNKIPYNAYYTVLKDYVLKLKKYKPVSKIVEKMHESAVTYNNILSVEIPDEDIKNKFVEIKFNEGDDTFAYLLEIYEDYLDKNITKETFLDILTAINEYLANRKERSGIKGNFNDLIADLNRLVYGDDTKEE